MLKLRFLSLLIKYLYRFSVLHKMLSYELYRIFRKTVIKEVNGLKMLLNLRDRGVSRDLFMYGKRELIPTNYLLNGHIVKEGDVVLDIGANIGYYVLIESKLVGEQGKVYAIEPVSSNLAQLQQNLKLNNCKNVEVFKLAVGDKNGKAKIYIPEKRNLSTLDKNALEGNLKSVEEIEVITVDSFLDKKPKPNFIRMDVEGYEFYIIKGMNKTLKLNIKLFIEIHPHKMTEEQLCEMLEILEKNGFYVELATWGFKVNENKLIRTLKSKYLGQPYIILKNTNIQTLKNYLLRHKYTTRVFFSKSQLSE